MISSDSNKWLLAGIPVALLALAGGAWLLLAQNRSELHQSLPSMDGTLSISNADNANLAIITAQIDTIIVDIAGPPEQVGKVRFYSEKPPNSKFDLPDDWGGLSGTITVPTGTLVELKPSRNTPVLIQDKNGERPGSSGKPILVDTKNLTRITLGKSSIGIQGNGPIKVEDEAPGGSLNDWIGTGTGEGPTSCGFGSQLLRDRCCSRKNENSTPTCAGEWTYSNTLRVCEYQCANETPPANTENPGNQNPGGNYDGGGGNYTPPPLPGAAPQDPTSQQCFSYSGEARSLCCDERLRNPLRIGPRPGFPDCIGRWRFDPVILNCRFQCADYGEMIQILNELRLNSPVQ